MNTSKYIQLVKVSPDCSSNTAALENRSGIVLSLLTGCPLPTSEVCKDTEAALRRPQ